MPWGKTSRGRERVVRSGKASHGLVFEHRPNWNKVLIHTAILGKVLQAKDIKQQMSGDGLVSDTSGRAKRVLWLEMREWRLCMRVCVCAFSSQSDVHDELGLLPNQAWVCSPTHSKTNLLTLGCGEGKHNIDCRAPSKENGQLMLKRPKLPDGFQGRGFKGRVREGLQGVWSARAQFLDWLASRWSFKHHQLSGFNQSRVYVLVVSSFHLVGVSFL